MSGQQQLERSVLESKERDELHAIANALGLEVAARSKKADFVKAILVATGVETAPEPSTEEKPKRVRRAKAPASIAPETQTEGPAVVTDSAPAESDSNGRDPATEGAPTEGVPTEGVPTVGVPTITGALPRDESIPSPPAAGPAPAPVPVPAAPSELVGSRAEAPTQAGGRVGTKPPIQGRFPAAAPVGGGTAAPSRQGSQAPPPQAPPPHQPTHQPSQHQAGGQGGQGGQHQLDRQQGGQTPGQGNGQSPQQSAQQGADLDGDAGNRRNRRRRGRDREKGMGTDVQGGTDVAFSGDPIEVSGYLELREEGFGFVRTKGLLGGPDDAYVSISQARRFALRRGDHIVGACRPAGPQEKYPAMLRIDTISGLNPEQARLRPHFENLVAIFPDAKLRLELPGDPANMTARIVDLVSPIGKGQRGLIVSPPKAGKTTLLKQIAHSIEVNNPEVHLMVLLVDERPEEVTDMRRSVRGEVWASTFDRPAEEHTQVAEMAMDRAKRLVETGKDVVVILDGITRLARAYNLAGPAAGRALPGGIDTGALYPPKQFFGAARNVEEGGSLTILATALVDTGSQMDEVIFEEFNGTANMELRLDRQLAERRLYPAIDVNASSTRHEELLFDRAQLQSVWKLRRVLNGLGGDGPDGDTSGGSGQGLELLMDKIKTTRSNDEFLAEIAKG